MTKKFKIQAKGDHLKKIAKGSSENALAELIWNSLDASAMNVSVRFSDSGIGINEIIISDDGIGIDYDEAENLFNSVGGSWKATKVETLNGRILHGKEGEGRFKAFVLGKIVDWDVTCKMDSKIVQYSIKENSDSLDEVSVSEPVASDEVETGVTVHITELEKGFQIFDKSYALNKLTPIFALYLKSYPDINLTIDGTKISPDEAINNTMKYELPPIIIDDKEYPVTLELVEWNGIDERQLWLCSEDGFPLVEYKRQVKGSGAFGYTAYLKSKYFSKMHSDGLIIVSTLNEHIEGAVEEASKFVKGYFNERTREESLSEIEEWKKEKIYPYPEKVSGPVEEAERKVFDIVALNVSRTLPDMEKFDAKTKAFQFRMIKQAIEKSPDDLQLIMTEVLGLPKKKQNELAEILKNTSLSAVISASKLVADRLKFLNGLEQLIFDKDFKKHLKERSQLHRMLADNSWVFGEEYAVSTDDESLTKVLKAHFEKAGREIVVNEPVLKLDKSKGIVDLMLSRNIPCNHSGEIEHIVVELKAPKVVIGQKEINQIKNYAYAVADDERFKGAKAKWDFLIISNNYDSFTEKELKGDRSKKGILQSFDENGQAITIRVKTWSEIFNENKHKLRFIKNELEFNIKGDDALKFLKERYEDYTKGLIVDKEDKDTVVEVVEDTVVEVVKDVVIASE